MSKLKMKSMRLGYGNGKVDRMLRRGWKLESISGGGLGGARMATFSKPKRVKNKGKGESNE